MDSPSSPTTPDAAEPTTTLAEDLPALYRAILERVAALEHVGARREAGRIRAAATRAYSSAWDEPARKMLNSLLGRADRALLSPDRPRAWPFLRKSVPAR